MNGTTARTGPMADVIAECRRQQETWAALSVRQRLRPVRALRRLLVSECDRLCAAATRNVGKSFAEVVATELLPLAEACRFLQRAAGRLLRPRRIPGRHRPTWLWPQHDTVHHRPHGLVGIIGTWNYPLLLNGVQVVQALTAGNAVLWKPSELAPHCAAVLFDLLLRAGFPAGLVHLMEATREGGRELAEADVDHVVFTGSDATGRQLAARLGQRLVSSTLELSGCDALFVLEDADVDLAARAAWFACTLNRGQTCLAVRRALVHHSIYPAFADALKPLLAAAQPMRLALESQVRQAERLVGAAVADGARLLEPRGSDNGRVSNGPGPPELCPVRVVLDARPEMAVCREASFAPLLAVVPFETVNEALHLDATCPYGLGASVFTRDRKRAAELAARLRVGVVTINDVIAPTAHPATPFGGRGASGWGVTQGEEGLLAMTVPQVVSTRRGRWRPHYDSFGTTWLSKGPTLRGLLEWGHAANFGDRCRGLWRMVKTLWDKT